MYYHFDIAYEQKVTGVRNADTQVIVIEEGFKEPEIYRRFMKRSLEHCFQRTAFEPDYEIDIQCGRLNRGAKLTDFMSFRETIWGCPFMLSQKAYDVFRELKFARHNYFPVALYKGDKPLEPYKLFQTEILGYEYIDFSRTVFYSGHAIMNNLEYHTFKSASEYQNYPKPGSLQVKKLAVNEHFDKGIDFADFRIGGMFISDRLKDAITKVGLTGTQIFDGSKWRHIQFLD